MDNLSKLCDRYIMNGSPKIRERVFNVLDQIATEAVDETLIQQSVRMVKRAGVPMHKTYMERFQQQNDDNDVPSSATTVSSTSSSLNVELGKTDSERRRREVEIRQEWERQQQQQEHNNNGGSSSGKSALSRRMESTTTNGGQRRPDLFMSSVLDPNQIATIASDKKQLQDELGNNIISGSNNDNNNKVYSRSPAVDDAANRVSEMIAKAGSGLAFDGDTLGIGGLDDVLLEIKRRIWTPLAAPPQLLKELGIHPVRGLLLYGKPGCGKSLLASTLGKLLSPFRPITGTSCVCVLLDERIND